MAIRFKVGEYKHPHYIREWRNYRGLTQDEVAEAMNVSKGTISRVETGDSPYSQDILEGLAVVLDTDPASLLRPPVESEALWSLWRRAQPSERQQLTEMAKVIVKTGTGG